MRINWFIRDSKGKTPDSFVTDGEMPRKGDTLFFEDMRNIGRSISDGPPIVKNKFVVKDAYHKVNVTTTGDLSQVTSADIRRVSGDNISDDEFGRYTGLTKYFESQGYYVSDYRRDGRDGKFILTQHCGEVILEEA